MSRINNDVAYVKDLAISPNDTVIGSDKDQSGRTKQYSFGEIVNFLQTNGALAKNPILEEDNNVIGIKNIDWNKDTFDFTLIGHTTLTESNLPETGFTKTITIYTKGKYDLTLPASWDRVQGFYDSKQFSQITVEYISPNNYWVSISTI